MFFVFPLNDSLYANGFWDPLHDEVVTKI